MIGIRHVPPAAQVKCYIRIARGRKGHAKLFIAAHESGNGLFRPFAAAQRYVRNQGAKPTCEGRRSNDVHDPNRSLAALKSRIAAPWRTKVCYLFFGNKGGIEQ